MKKVYTSPKERRVAINKRMRERWAFEPKMRKARYAQHKKWIEKNRKKVQEYDRTYNAEYRKTHKEKLAAMKWARHLKQNYALTVDEHKALIKKQKGRCKICHLKKKLCVDHCHKKGHVRGLLCDSCNVGLGKFNDNIRLLQKAIKYLGG